MKHHFLPQFYLRGFSDPDVVAPQEPYLWVYKASERMWRRRAPKNLARQSDYYAVVDSSGKTNHDVEKALGIIESKTAATLKEIAPDCNELSDEQRRVLATFVALMMARLPGFHERISHFLCENAQLSLELQHSLFRSDPEAYEDFKKWYAERKGEPWPGKIGASEFDPVHYRITPNKQFVQELAFGTVETCASIICNMGWTFIVPQPPHYFITSDAPFFVYDPSNQYPFFGAGLAMADVEVTLPLSRDLLLFAGWHSTGTRTIVAPTRMVAQLNVRSGCASSRFLLSPKPTFPGCDRFGLASET